MENKTISIMLMAALTFAIVGIAGMKTVQAYTAEDLSSTVTAAYNAAKNLRVSSFAMETCTNQINAGDYSNIDACVSMTKTFDKYMTQAVTEANSDIQQITGYGQQGLIGSSGLVN